MSHSIETKNINFYSKDSVRLSGDLYIPQFSKPDQKFPAIVLCQGLSGEKHKVLPLVAKEFASAGYVVLAFDYAGCGQSEDRRKCTYVFPDERIDDTMSAIAYVNQLPHVDPTRIGLYSISYGGPVALTAASYDKRIRCVVIVSGPGDGPEFLSSLMNRSEWINFLTEVEKDRSDRACTGTSKLVPITDVIKFPQSFWARYALLDSSNDSESLPREAEKSHTTMISLESADAMLKSLPSTVVHLISPRSLLFIHGEKDDVAKIVLARELYNKAEHPKKFVGIPSMDHIDLDTGKGLKKQIGIALDWFDQHL